MRLIELTANQESFRTVTFNRTGLSLIVGRKKDPEDRSREHSTNAVGKSLLLYLISFCLGSKENPELGEQLKGWEFTLSFESDGKHRRVTRSTDNQKLIILDLKEIKLDDYTKLLGRDFFGLEQPVKHLTFRSLVGMFLRQGKAAYMDYSTVANGERQYTKQIRAAYLMGLDEHLVDKKRELREESERLKALRQQFKKDSFLCDYFVGDKDAALELKDLEEETARLQGEAGEFRVAENYEEMVAKAEQTRLQWRTARNEYSGLESSLRQIEASLNEQPDLSAEAVEDMYKAASVELSDMVTRRLEDVTTFHRELLESRNRRLTAEKHRIERRIATLKDDLGRLDAEKDEYFQFLGSHGALREYEALLTRIAELQRQAVRLSEFQQLQAKTQERTQKNKLEMSAENIRATEYLKSAKTLTDSFNDSFRSMARRIWPGKTSGITVTNNDGVNLTRFDIQSRIQTDASDGVSESAIFCFDSAILYERQNHRLNFLMHDNRLYPGIDPRQRAELFRIAQEFSERHDCQYIASLNDDDLETMRSQMESSEAFDALFTAATVLELTDESDAGKLLGITVDLKYDGPSKRKAAE